MFRTFKIGDIVTGIKEYGNTYNITNSDMTKGKVIAIYDYPTDSGSDMRVQVLEHRYSRRIGDSFPVCSKYFELVNEDGTVRKLKFQKQKYVKCSCCGHSIPIDKDYQATNGNYVCSYCSMTKPYETKNNTMFHKTTKSHKTYGFELECVPKSFKHKLSMINATYGLIPTSDGSLPSGGVEFKTPIYNGMRGLRTLFKSFDKYANFSSSSCGQHINIGDTEHINSNTIPYIRGYAERLFDPLYHYMHDNREDTVKIVGRYFTGYADKDYSYTAHSSWINLDEYNRIEFRLSKFVNPNQYFELICMWTEMVDCIINNFLPIHDYVSADNTSQMLIDIFKKYASRQAKVQQKKTA